MNFKEIVELIDKVADRGLASLEIEQAGLRLRIEGVRIESAAVPSSAVAPSAVPAGARGIEAAATSSQTAGQIAEENIDESWHVITSPIVGTFYRAANPESESFANEGDRVTKGKVLCIIEAMKLMNEIESDFDGVIVKVFPQNGQPIEYGEKLFALKP
ncbi:MAG TPA: acetyl-CoA carboxylase biotin carboxyl carrier protein [Thermoanaerobaculia bacterium]|nr:acetyl-CoA carboxylase biotin carboxyl carrier protein [Thermoanaerobaculia bacterium]